MSNANNDNSDLRKRILEEMTVESSGVLSKNFDLAKKFVRITKNGKVEVLVRDKVTGQERILLYLIGKQYAKEAGSSTTNAVSNKELMDELSIPKGSLLPWLMALRKSPGIKQVKEEKQVSHFIPVNLVESVLKTIEEKMKA
jgi:hypothetical protein